MPPGTRKRIKLPREHLLVNTFRFVGNDRVGSGFVAQHDVPGTGTEFFLVTNQHVVRGVETGECIVATCKGIAPQDCELSGTATIKTPRDSKRGWFGHEDPENDVAIYRMGRDPLFMNDTVLSLEYATIKTRIFATESPEIDYGEEVVFVGYPAGRTDAVHATPVFRMGAIASSPGMNWNGKRTFLIDASVFPGSSGSPVFAPADKGQLQHTGFQFELLGIVSKTTAYNGQAQLIDADVPVSPTEILSLRNYLDLGVVTKAVCIREAIEGVVAGKATLIQ